METAECKKSEIRGDAVQSHWADSGYDTAGRYGPIQWTGRGLHHQISPLPPTPWTASHKPHRLYMAATASTSRSLLCGSCRRIIYDCNGCRPSPSRHCQDRVFWRVQSSKPPHCFHDGCACRALGGCSVCYERETAGRFLQCTVRDSRGGGQLPPAALLHAAEYGRAHHNRAQSNAEQRAWQDALPRGARRFRRGLWLTAKHTHQSRQHPLPRRRQHLHPSSLTHLRHTSPIAERESSRSGKYAAMTQRHSVILVPFAMDTFGGVRREAGWTAAGVESERRGSYNTRRHVSHTPRTQSCPSVTNVHAALFTCY